MLRASTRLVLAYFLPLAALYSVNLLTNLVDLIELASCALEVVLGPGLSWLIPK